MLTEHKHKSLIAEATQTANEYILKKYGFNPDKISMSKDKYPWFFDNNIEGYCPMELKIEYDSDKFYVYTYNIHDISEYSDDYQYEDICNAVEQMVTKDIPSGVSLYSYLCADDNCFFNLLDMNTFYNQTNLTEILEKCQVYTEMAFSNVDFSEEDLREKSDKLNTEIKFTSFDTASHMNEFVQKYKDSEHKISNKNYRKYVPYIRDYIEISSEGTKRLNITMQKNAEFSYAFFSKDSFSETLNNIHAYLIYNNSIEKYFSTYNAEQYLEKPLSCEYLFTSDYNLWVYYPIDDIIDDPDNIGAAWFHNKKITYGDHSIIEAEICGENAVFEIPLESTFMIVDNSGQEKYIPKWQSDFEKSLKGAYK